MPQYGATLPSLDQIIIGPCGTRLSSSSPLAHNCACARARQAVSRLALLSPRLALAGAGGVDMAIGGGDVNTTQPLGFDPGARHGPPGITAPASLAHPPGQPGSSLVPWHCTR